MDTEQFETRKREHIQHSLDPAHQACGLSGLDQIHLVHEALPDLNFSEIHLESSVLGRPIQTPFYVAGMTAGHADAFQLNRTIAQVCQERGWAMGVGSQRRELENAGGGSLDQWKALRDEAPDLVLFANLGISQLISAKVESVQKVIQSIQAQGLVVHLNSLQEAIQPEGTPEFKGSLEALKQLCAELKTPVILKETGCGFSKATLERVAGIGLAAVDVSGLGGTHWGRIEGARANRDSVQAKAAQTFSRWGVSTVDSVRSAAFVFQKTPIEIWASGGVRSGLDAAKLIALGAHRVGYAKPVLEAALQGIDSLRFWMETQEFELKVALFCTGSQNFQSLRQKETYGY
jgi:isopentenyl-diphosphate delta-isomerase